MNLVFIHVSRYQNTPYAKLMLWSVNKHMPNAKLYQLTDLHGTKLAGVDGLIRAYQDYDTQVGYNQIFFGELLKLDLPEYIWIDPDMAFTGDISNLMEGDFDVGICTRHENDGANDSYRKTNPYNVGIVVVKTPKFIEDCYQRLKQFIDLKRHIVQHTIGLVVDSGKYKIKFFDGLIYNRAPSTMHEYDPKTLVWHFKGAGRKKWMISWMEKYLNGGRPLQNNCRI